MSKGSKELHEPNAVTAAETKDKKVDKKPKKEKKEKNTKQHGSSETAPSSSFSLFGGKTDAQLDDVFSKGSAFAITPTQPVASSSRLVQPDPAPVEPSRKRKNRPTSDATPAASASTSEAAQTVKLSRRQRARSSATSSSVKGSTNGDAVDNEEVDEEEDDDEGDVSTLVHESVSKRAKKKQKAEKYAPAEETQADRDRRTIFIGNISLETLKAKSGLNQLKAHIMTFTPGAKIESARFRSVPFAAPTAGTNDDEAEGVKRAKREKERAAAWKAQQEVLKSGDKNRKEELDTSASFIDSKGKRKVAFIKKEFHNEADSCNAYVVFAHPPPDRPTNLPPLLNPYEAAQLALKADGSVLHGHTIRVDVVRSSDVLASATTNLARRDAWTAGADPKKSVFVGGVDYAAKEEDLRVFFEELLKSERGSRSEKYVANVRIVRDKQTQMGKGFAYVHLADGESVDELLGADESKLRFAKKTLRIQRAKTLPSSKPISKAPTPDPKSASRPQSKASQPPSSHKPFTKPAPKPAGPLPKGNPALGEKIRSLSKDERKVAKAADDDRQARRLAKKKLRGKMGVEAEKGAVKLLPTKGEKARGKKVVAKKSRVRSSNALAKMKGSRT